MKVIFSFALLFGTLLGASARAGSECTPNPTKIFLIIEETPGGLEDVMVGDIDSNDGSIELFKKSYTLVSDGPVITIQGSRLYKFDRRKVISNDERYCSRVILAK